MSELRYNLISREWVIIATDRARRPHDFILPTEGQSAVPEFVPDCPFCPGNEEKTPPELFRIGEGDSWRVRVTHNKFPALRPDTDLNRVNTGFYRYINGVGVHEVIIENRRHNAHIPFLTLPEIEDILKTYKARYIALQQDSRIEAILIFKNHGLSAGTSLEHPHSQIIATPIVPTRLRLRKDQAINYFDDKGSCIFCKVLEEEIKSRVRLVCESEHFVSFVPYAALSPFTLWIFPRRHMASYDDINDAELKDLAYTLKITLGRLSLGLNNPDYNYVIRSVPVKEKITPYFHWYISIIPRLTKVAGFELGSGMFINTSLPEESAEFLRGIRLEEHQNT